MLQRCVREEKPVRSSDEQDGGAEVVVLLDSEPLRRELVAQALRVHDPSLSVLEVASSLDAVAFAQRRAVGLYVVAATDSARLVRHAEEIHRELPHVPIVGLLDGEGVGPLAGLDAVLGAPLDLDRILAVTGELLEATESFVRGLALEAVLQLLHQERKTCRVLLERQGSWGVVHLRAGRVVHAETPDLSGTAALFELLDWSAPSMRVRERGSIPRASIHEELPVLLLEHAVWRDSRRRDGVAEAAPGRAAREENQS